MARSLKPQKIHEVALDNTELRADIYFDRNKLTFFARLGDEDLDDTAADTADACRELALAQLRERAAYTWTPVILVDYERVKKDDLRMSFVHKPRRGAAIRFDFRRCEVSGKPGGKKRRVERPMAQDLSAEELKRREKQTHGYRDLAWDFNFELPYHDDIWDGLTRLAAIFRNADEQLGVLLGMDPDALTRALARVPSNLLAPGTLLTKKKG